MKPDGQNSVIQKWMLPESLVFRPLVKGNEDSGNEIAFSFTSLPMKLSESCTSVSFPVKVHQVENTACTFHTTVKPHRTVFFLSNVDSDFNKNYSDGLTEGLGPKLARIVGLIPIHPPQF